MLQKTDHSLPHGSTSYNQRISKVGRDVDRVTIPSPAEQCHLEQMRYLSSIPEGAIFA